MNVMWIFVCAVKVRWSIQIFLFHHTRPCRFLNVLLSVFFFTHHQSVKQSPSVLRTANPLLIKANRGSKLMVQLMEHSATRATSWREELPIIIISMLPLCCHVQHEKVRLDSFCLKKKKKSHNFVIKKPQPVYSVAHKWYFEMILSYKVALLHRQSQEHAKIKTQLIIQKQTENSKEGPNRLETYQF